MQPRLITRVVNALGAQQRLILWLECHHTQSISDRYLIAHNLSPTNYAAGDLIECAFCPDPVVDTRVVRSAQSLYREAGEPDV